MALKPWYSPFFVVENEAQQFGTELDILGANVDLHRVGRSSLGTLFWNNSMTSLGLVCGADGTENSSVLQRLMLSHKSDPFAHVLVLHTDHFSVKRTCCPLINATWPQPRILLSPHTSQRLNQVYNLSGATPSPIAFNADDIRLSHVLALFTPPPDFDGHALILSTIQLILSQLHEPFDLQRKHLSSEVLSLFEKYASIGFIELIDQETWSKEGAAFVALRQTILTKLLSPEVDAEEHSRQLTVVDLTDPVLWTTALDSVIMDIAVHKFMRFGNGKKMIVLNNSHQYLTKNSSLTRTLETLAAIGKERPATIVLSTTDPTKISFALLNSLQYVISGSSSSAQWTSFLRQHFATKDPWEGQVTLGRATIWSPVSVIYHSDTLNGDSKEEWGLRLPFIDIEEFRLSMHPKSPEDLHTSKMHLGNAFSRELEAEHPSIVKMRLNNTRHEVVFEEEGIISLDNLEFESSSRFMPDYETLSSGLAAPVAQHPTMVEPILQVTQHILHSPELPPDFSSLVAAILTLSGGERGVPADFEAVRKQFGKEATKQLGWTFTKLVRLACQHRAVELVANPGFKSMLLVPPSNIVQGDGPPPAQSSVKRNANILPPLHKSPPPPPLQPNPRISPAAISDKPEIFRKHLYVVSTVTKLLEGTSRMQVRMLDLTALLRSEKPREKPENIFFLITEAVKDCVLKREVDQAGTVWVSIFDPPSPTPLIQQKSGGDDVSESGLLSFNHAVEYYPPRFQPLASSILSRTQGQYDVPVKMESIIRALLTEYSTQYRNGEGAVSLILEASMHKIVYCSKENGVWWASLAAAAR